MLPRLLLTPGEPAGIGPDLCIAVAQQSWPCELVVVADPELMAARAERLQMPLTLSPFAVDVPAEAHSPGRLKIQAVPMPQAARCGQLDRRNAHYVLQTIRHASGLCLQGCAQALVTGPVQKSIINDAGVSFSGHTEFIAGITGGQAVMMLATPRLRVALVTTHMPLSQVSAAITVPHLENVIRILHRDLQTRFGLTEPVLLVCGLNPHAGEAGHLGREDMEIIEPVLARLCLQGLNLHGPLPADTAFTPERLDQADAILSMYHDQGLPVLKALGFGEAVNITLGLPIIRTSVDHGTALDLAGSGKASSSSLAAAIQTAYEMALHNTAASGC